MRAAAWLLAVSTLWGTSFAVIKIAAMSLDPLGIAALRSVIAAVFLLVLGSAMRRVRWPDARSLGRFGLLSVVGQIIPFSLLGIQGNRI